MKKILGVYTLLTLLIACNPADDITLEAGESFTNTNIRVIQIDTMTVDFSTFKFDSVPFPSGGRILIGNYNDAIFGKTASKTYAEFTPNSYNLDNEAVFDSIVLILGYDNYFYNDTLTQMTFNVKQVSKRIKPFDDEYFYNTTNISVNNELIGSTTFTPKPISGDSVRITLNYNLGYSLFTKIKDNDITDIDQYREYFKGLLIESEQNNNGSVLGFATDYNKTLIRMYYSVPEDISEEVQVYDLPIATDISPQPYFNNITAETNNTVFQNFSNQENTYDSDQLNNKFYFQAGVGIGNKITIPHIKTLNEIGKSGTVLNASLKLYIDQQSYSSNVYLKDSLYTYITDRHQNVTGLHTDYLEENVLGSLTYDNEFSETYYTIPLTVFVDEVLNSNSDQDLAITLLPYEYETCVNRGVFNNDNSGNYSAVLQITYAVYENE